MLRRLGSDRGFTMIEVLVASVILLAISAPIGAVLVSGAKATNRTRNDTSADQIAQAQIEYVRALPYAEVGLTNGNPSGVVAATDTTHTVGGKSVTVKTTIVWVSDAIPNGYVTDGDYKKIVVTVTRDSDNAVLATKTTLIAAASAPSGGNSTYVTVKRTVLDPVTNTVLPGANVNLTGGPSSENRNDTTDGAGKVEFPALASSSSTTPPDYTLTTTLSGYSVYPDDLPNSTYSAKPQPEQVPAAPGWNSPDTIRMYKQVSLTVNLRNSAGNSYSGGATVSISSSRCGSSAVSVPSGQSSTTVNQCTTTNGQTIPLVPNLTGQVPTFDNYAATAWTGGGSPLYGAATPVVVPTSYPSNLSQSITVTLSSGGYATKTLKVTVNCSASPFCVASPDKNNARVQLTGGPVSNFSEFATTDGSGIATFTVPVTATSTTYTASANDSGRAKGTGTVSASTGSPSTITTTVTMS